MSEKRLDAKNRWRNVVVKMYVLGGGAKLLEHFSTFNRSRITFNFDINANAKGYEYFCYVALKKKKLGIAG